MKTHFTRMFGVCCTILLSTLLLSFSASGQGCQNSIKFPMAAFTPNADGSYTNISGCNYWEDFSELTGIVDGYEYELTSYKGSTNGYITVREGSVGGTVVASGYSPLTFTATSGSNIFLHWTADEFCNTASGCAVTGVTCNTCAEPPASCLNSTYYPSSAVTVNADGSSTLIAYCNFQSEYSQITGITSGYEYEFMAESGYITVRSGSFDGPVVGQGMTPLTVTATSSAALFAHWNADASCATASTCIETAVTCVTCATVPDCEGVPGGPAQPGTACNDGNPNTHSDMWNAECECVGFPAGECVNDTRYPFNAVSATEDLTQISGCQYLREYSEITSISSGEQYEFTVTGGGYITVRTGSVAGSLVAAGYSPLTVTAPSADDLFVHWNADDDCGQATGCQTTTVQCISCGVPPCENPYPAVTGLDAQVQGNGVMLSWNPIAGSIGCQLSIGSEPGPPPTTKTFQGDAPSEFYIPGRFLNYETTYLWQVRCGCSTSPLIVGPWSSSFFTTPSGAGIASSPNPTADVSNVVFSVVEEGTTTLEVYDMNGRSIQVLYSGDADPSSEYRFQFDGSVLPAGFYIYRLTTPSEVVIEKFMIAK